MKKSLLLLLTGLGVVGLGGEESYSSLQDKNQAVLAAMGDLKSSLQAKARLIPSLADTLKSYTNPNQQSALNIGQLAQMGKGLMGGSSGGGTNTFNNIQSLEQMQKQIETILGKLTALADSHPEIKLESTYKELQRKIAQAEINLILAKRKLNKKTEKFNVSIDEFPGNIINKLLLKFKKKPTFTSASTSPDDLYITTGSD